jgi:hypothetical protein
MKLRLALASLFVATTAYAQAPGAAYPGGAEASDEVTTAPGMTEPVVVAPTPPRPRPRRWSIGLGFGSVNLAPHSNPEIETEYAVGQLAVRFLATRHLEIELAVAGGTERLEDGSEGNTEISQGVIALRYRFAPGRRWNWWLMAGMGSLAVTEREASEEQRDLAQQSTLQFGVGLERRWRRFALQLEVRAVGVAPHEEASPDVVVTEPGGRPDGMSVPPKEPPTTTYANDGMAGGQLVFSGNYYF